jgi:hypothetical protein
MDRKGATERANATNKETFVLLKLKLSLIKDFLSEEPEMKVEFEKMLRFWLDIPWNVPIASQSTALKRTINPKYWLDIAVKKNSNCSYPSRPSTDDDG